MNLQNSNSLRSVLFEVLAFSFVLVIPKVTYFVLVPKVLTLWLADVTFIIPNLTSVIFYTQYLTGGIKE